MKINHVILINIAMILLFAFNPTKVFALGKTPSALNGSFDVSSWSFEQDGMLELNGEWAYYPEQLLIPEYINWKRADINIANVPSNSNIEKQAGFSTYTLQVKGLKPGLYGLSIPNLYDR